MDDVQSANQQTGRRMPIPMYLVTLGVGIVMLSLAGGVAAWQAIAHPQAQQATVATSSPNDYSQYEQPHVAFTVEVFDKIQTHYWDEMSNEKLAGIFAQGIRRVEGDQSSSELTAESKDELISLMQDVLAGKSRTEQDTVTREVTTLVLQSLPPAGRSGLYTEKKEKQLAQQVNNVNPDRNLYEAVGAPDKASTTQVKEAYEKTKQTVSKQKQQATETKQQLQERKQAIQEKQQQGEISEEEAQQQLQETQEKLQETQEKLQVADKKMEEAEYAKEVLTDKERKQRYDSVGAEPTVFSKLLTDDIAHIYIKRFSPNTPREFSRAAQRLQSGEQEPSVLVLDLRSNIGGAIDLLPYLLGPFVGPDTYAYKTFRNGTSTRVKTKTGWLNTLVPYKQVAILTDGKTQSTGEVMTAALKKFNVGTVVGKTTRGWGTIERVFEIENQFDNDRRYSIFLVHTLTLRNDGQPIEGRGVVPHVTINENNDWQERLHTHTRNDALIEQIDTLWNKPLPGNI
jgi:actin-related protein